MLQTMSSHGLKSGMIRRMNRSMMPIKHYEFQYCRHSVTRNDLFKEGIAFLVGERLCGPSPYGPIALTITRTSIFCMSFPKKGAVPRTTQLPSLLVRWAKGLHPRKAGWKLPWPGPGITVGPSGPNAGRSTGASNAGSTICCTRNV